MGNSGAGCLIGLFIVLSIIALIIYIIVMIAFFALIAAVVIAAVMIVLGALYGIYRGLLCYAVAVKRTYGHLPNYKAGKGMKTLVIFSTLLLFVAAFFVFMYFNGVNIFSYTEIADFIIGLFEELEYAIRIMLN